MFSQRRHGNSLSLVAAVSLGVCLACPTGAQDEKPPAAKPPATAVDDAAAGREYSGMYSFRKEGEFVQVTIEEGARVTGFVSRYGDGESDKGEFLDQFFKTGKLAGNKLSFTTQTVHGTWFSFDGTIERGSGKAPADEDYYALKGTLTESTTDVNKHTSSQSRGVLLKRFPGDLNAPQPPQN